MKNQGKIFENNWKESSIQQGVLTIRLNDSSTSFIMEKNARFTPENPCDYIQFYKKTLFCMELKSTKYKSMSIQLIPEDKNKMIKLHQINSLVNFSQYNNVIAGFVLNFRDMDESSKDEDTYFLKISDFSDFLNQTGKKSINKLDVVQYNGIKVNQKLKRVNYIYQVSELFDKLTET